MKANKLCALFGLMCKWQNRGTHIKETSTIQKMRI